MKAPSTTLLRLFSPFRESTTRQWLAPGCLARPQLKHHQQRADFSSTPQLQKRNKGKGAKPDRRITAIRYHLYHPLTPRPLRWSRLRALRHWTIHRAWQLYQSKLRQKRHAELLRQYESMARACEALRNIDNYGLTTEERLKLGEPPNEGKETGRLYRIAMLKKGMWDGPPIEYARIQTDSPPRDGWNHEWTR